MAMRTVAPPAEQTAGVTRMARPRQRQAPMMALGVLLVAVCALGAVMLSRSAARRVEVLVAANDLQPGQPIRTTDLRLTRVSADTNARFIAATDEGGLVGRVPRGFVPAGTPLNVGMFAAAPQIPAGDSVVGAVLGPGAVPITLATGETVRILVTAPNGGASPLGTQTTVGPTDAGTATVFSVTTFDSTSSPDEKVWVSLVAPAKLSGTIAEAAQDGRLRLAVVSGS